MSLCQSPQYYFNHEPRDDIKGIIVRLEEDNLMTIEIDWEELGKREYALEMLTIGAPSETEETRIFIVADYAL